jgi:cytochrome c553
VAAELTRERMIASITNGRPGTAMMAYGSQFSKADIDAMADFIQKAFMSGSSSKQ